MRRLLLAAALVASAAGLGVGGAEPRPAAAATPAAGTVGPATGRITWTGPAKGALTAPAPGSNPTKSSLDLTCAVPPAFCDDFSLTIEPASGHVTVVAAWPIATDDFDLHVFDAAGNPVASVKSGAPTNEQWILTAPAPGTYLVRVVYRATFFAAYRAGAVASASGGGGGGGGGGGEPPPPPDLARFHTYEPPPGLGVRAGEPTLGVDWRTNDVMYEAFLETLRVRFDDCTSPAATTWLDRSPPTAVNSFDPILTVDSETGPDRPSRCFVSHLAGKTSLMSFSDDGGETWTPSQGAGVNSGVDHQSLGVGPYAPGFGLPAPGQPYPRAVYYCSQDLALSYCARSDTGGLTFGAAVPLWRTDQCGGIHGHPKIARDGTVYVPNYQCDLGGTPGQTVVVSEDNGATWSVRPVVPGSTPGGDDPSVALASDGTVYFGYKNGDGKPRVAVSKDKGRTWINDQAVADDVGVLSAVFPSITAGDADRAAFAFIGTTTPGDNQDFANFRGEWHLYVSMTYDGGRTWRTVDVTPHDPVQRGSICQQGALCANPKNDRNLLDFMDATYDRDGRVLVAFADGCIDLCVAGGENSYTSRARIARQSGGRRLFAANDPPPVALPGSPRVDVREVRRGVTEVSWARPDDGGSPILHYRVYRRASPSRDAPAELLTTTTGTSYVDMRPPGSVAWYQVTAVNGVGESGWCGQVLSQGLAGACAPPGAVVVSDGRGDQAGPPSHDLHDVSVAEPYFGPTARPLVVTLTVASLETVPPGTAWVVYFKGPDGVPRGLQMESDAAGNVRFEHGLAQQTATGGYQSELTDVAPLDPGSGYRPDGTITFVVAAAKVGDPRPGDRLVNIAAALRVRSRPPGPTATTDRLPDGGGVSSAYQLVGNDTCQPTGYWMAARDGGVFSFGDARFFGSTGSMRLNSPVVGMAPTVSGAGYWLVAADGGVFSFGDARFFGSTGSMRLNSPVVAMAATPTGNGYWLVAADGGVFSFGDAAFHGSMGATRLNSPVVAAAAAPAGGGYWMAAADGGVFSFGSSPFAGSMGGTRLNSPVVGLGASPSGSGYWLAAADGGVFTFGDAAFYGSMGGAKLNAPVVGLAATPSGTGYWLAASDGGVFTFGIAPFAGSMGGTRLNSPVVGAAASPVIG